MIKTVVFILMSLSLSFANAACLQLTENALATQDARLVDVPLTLKKSAEKSFNTIQRKKQQKELTEKLIYNRPDVFEAGEEFDILAVENQHDYTHMTDYTKGAVQIRIFDNKFNGQVAGVRFGIGKKMSIVPVDTDCQPHDFTLVDGGGRCFVKQSDCRQLMPLTPEKLKSKCSFLPDTKGAMLQLASSSCALLEKDSRGVAGLLKAKTPSKNEIAVPTSGHR